MAKDELEKLKDIQLPDPISFELPIEVWLAGLSIVILISSVIVIWSLKKRSSFVRNKPKREALAMLKQLKLKYDQGLPMTQVIAEISILLRRVALVYYSRSEVAGLSGAKWMAFLQRTAKQPLSVEKLFELAYQQDANDSNHDMGAMFKFCNHWINEQGK